MEQLGQNLRELRSLENAGSLHEAQETLNRLLAAQEQERKEVEEQITDNTRLLEGFQADHQRLAIESKESEMIIQAARQAILDSRAAIARAEAVIATNEQKLATSEKRLAELEAAKAQVEANLSVRSSRLESLRVQAKRFLSEEELRAQALMEAEKARQHDASPQRTNPFFGEPGFLAFSFFCKEKDTLFTKSVCMYFYHFLNNKSR